MKLKPVQLRVKPLYCTGSSNCWCAKVSIKLPIPILTDECMSPEELLNIYKDILPSKDILYLNTIKNREFIV